MPSWGQLLRAIARGKGSAGYDGWTARELKMMAVTFDVLVRDLCDLWLGTTKFLGANGMFKTAPVEERPEDVVNLQKFLFSSRIVGIPKKCGASRPIGVASAAQHACKAEPSVCQAVCSWLKACITAMAGMERDLSKCYDQVPHE
eukprot:4860397-Pyramimonas_sp.AAC.1